jgi:hypothetical protein
MVACHNRRLPTLLLAVAIFLLGWIIRSAIAEEPDVRTVAEIAQTALEQIQAPKQPSPQTKPEEAPAKGAPGADAAAAGQKFDPAVVTAGMAAFEQSCTNCHDAARSLERTKDLAGWRATVRRMAAKRGADVASGDIEPIAVYLASRNAAGTTGANGTAGASGAAADKDKAGSDTASVSTFATLSPLWRGGNSQLQNSGFGPLAWVGASWQSKILSARVTVCIACHGVQEQSFLSRVDIVEAAVRADLSEFIEPYVHGMKGGIDAGRFVVPFGAFSAQTNPGLYRTVSTPLIFNMGQRIFNQDIGDTVLPMPYADTGVNLNLDVPVGNLGTGPITATMDSYLVNGLQGSGNGIDFLQSRNLLDNNNTVAGGGRLTLGDPYIRAGASFMTGRFDNTSDAGVPSGPLNYRIYGFDLQARYKKLFRCQVEVARRETDRVGFLANGPEVFGERVDGYYLETEVRPWEECRVSFLARHDILRRSSPLPPPASTLVTGDFSVERLTLGINIELWHQSLLMIDFERWFLPEPEKAVNVFGVRYTITF